MPKSDLMTYAVCNILDPVTKREIQDSIKRIATKIHPSNKIKNNKKYTDIKHEMDSIDYWNYMKVKYMETCCWLINQIEDSIANMIYKNKTEQKEKFCFDMGDDEMFGLGLTTNPDVNTNIGGIPEAWMKMDYEMPFYYVKQLMEEKGYLINTYSHKTDPDKVINEKLYYPCMDFHQAPIETYMLEIKIINNNIKNEGVRKKRSREDE